MAMGLSVLSTHPALEQRMEPYIPMTNQATRRGTRVVSYGRLVKISTL